MTNVIAFPILVNEVDINFVTSKVPQIATNCHKFNEQRRVSMLYADLFLKCPSV